jgi:hypothetical protein
MLFFIDLLRLFHFKVFIRTFNNSIKTFIQVPPIGVVHDFFHQTDELVCDHKVYSQAQYGHCFVGFLKMNFFLLHFLQKLLVLPLVLCNLFNQSVLLIDQLNALFYVLVELSVFL